MGGLLAMVLVNRTSAKYARVEKNNAVEAEWTWPMMALAEEGASGLRGNRAMPRGARTGELAGDLVGKSVSAIREQKRTHRPLGANIDVSHPGVAVGADGALKLIPENRESTQG